ncbi:peptide-methionine (S)-S-oxide reductase MsrA [Cellulomonas wangsupingiae]|uniref:Peptide methionine sulfoxide reductase MsrA n=1 Tax=Cellulomonas wangsupingiae TaxID=2968085 RepID=A0ABY5K726_9CELL|nr:peptide-methionine (S)-S-oxide reductase MsrA [Cellulomonas wangsupingiae]MCC2334390.1 peptide-methionine (S)-S-oxide reductase MsrA [Cellulomonas wangsupingiae]UUI66059.1 peptide-methionine (S)-S-oxide reductase MsrA [Cellulomonas wangsupingiae]
MASLFETLLGTSLRTTMVDAEHALKGRDGYAYPVPATHAVLGTPLQGPWPEGTRVLYLASGCFWGAEKEAWQLPGVVTTAVGYMGGFTPYPTYEETCTGRTGHTETVMVAYDPAVLSDVDLMRHFWEEHDPTQGFRQGNDVGTQYRSAVFFTTPEQEAAARETRDAYAPLLKARGYGDVTTEIRSVDDAGTFYYAEGPHQQYLHKNPGGYCPVNSTGVACPLPPA